MRDPRSRDSLKSQAKFILFFWSGKQRTISPIFRRPNFTKFAHDKSVGEAIELETSETEF